MDDCLEAAGVDPHHTATDNLPEHAAWDLYAYMMGEEYEE